MAYDFSVEQKPAYLHAKVSGDLTRLNALQFLVDAYQACIDRNVNSLLLEVAFTGGLHLGEVYSVISERSQAGRNLERIAYVNANPDLPRDTAEFAELVAQNRGVNVRLFRTLSEAEQWLQSSAMTREETLRESNDQRRREFDRRNREQ
jgi:SpoIIAA-like